MIKKKNKLTSISNINRNLPRYGGTNKCDSNWWNVRNFYSIVKGIDESTPKCRIKPAVKNLPNNIYTDEIGRGIEM